MEDGYSQVSMANQTIHMGNILLSLRIDMLSERSSELLLHRENLQYPEIEYPQI